MSEMTAARLMPGDWFVWCDRPLKVEHTEVKRRRWSVRNEWDNDRGLYVTASEMDGTTHRLHYYSDERVRLFHPTA